MALNIATFKTRSLSALLFVVVMFTGLFWNQWSFFALFTLIHFGCWIEYNKLMGKIYPYYADLNPAIKWGFPLVGWGGMWYMLSFAALASSTLEYICFWVLGAGSVAILFEAYMKPSNLGRKLLISFLGLLYVSVAWCIMIGFRSASELMWLFSKEFGNPTAFQQIVAPVALPLVLILSIWINDTMAYIVGSFIGKTPFSSISPKKTWEGTVGGALLCVGTMMLAGHLSRHQLGGVLQLRDWAVIAAIAAIAGTAGDLLESKLKRMAGVKDSGHILPGHGGFLDRFDSLLIATPVVAIYILLFGL